MLINGRRICGATHTVPPDGLLFVDGERVAPGTGILAAVVDGVLICTLDPHEGNRHNDAHVGVEWLTISVSLGGK